MSVANPYEKVMDNKVFSASKEELTLMLYEGAIKFGNQANIAITKKDFPKANSLILRVQDIVRELQVTLDPKYEISVNINALYDYMYRRLVDANFGKSTEILDEVLGLLREFRDTWKEAMKLAKQN